MKILLSVVAFLALMADAVTTYAGLKENLSESNKIRKWIIDKLGLKLGTFGVAACLGIVVYTINFFSLLTPSVVLMNLVVILFASYAAYNNYNKLK